MGVWNEVVMVTEIGLRDKARLVGKGYTQQYGLDYNDTWAAVTRLDSVRMSAAVAAKLDLHLWQVDFVSAYLNSETKEDIYMRQPPGYVVEDKKIRYASSSIRFTGLCKVATTGSKLLGRRTMI